MKIKRVLQGTALTALAAAAWMGAGSDASAAVAVSNVTASGNTLTIARNSNAEIMVNIVQVKNSKVSFKSWDVYDGAGDVTIDLSKLNVTKDNYIAIKANDGTEPFFLKIEAMAKPSKPTYNYSTQVLTFGDAGTAAEYRTATSSWNDVAGADFTQYQYQGASLYMRVKASLTNPTTADSEKVDDKATKDVTEEYAVYKIGKLASKEVKLNMVKQANGPSLKGDYAKGLVKTKDNLSCRMVKGNEFYKLDATNKTNSSATSSSAIGTTGFKSTDLENLLGGFSAGDKVVLEVRTDATEKKPASKWSCLDIEVPSMIADQTNTTVFPQSAGIATDEAIVVSGTAVKASVTFTDKGKKGAHTYTEIVVKNDGTATLDVKVEGGTKTSTIKAGKTVKFKKADANTKDLFVRVAGDKNNLTWPGAWTCPGKVAFPADVTAPATDAK